MNKQEYEKQLKKLKYENDILKKQLNELKNVKNDDEYPQVGDIYWFINTGGDIVYNRWENDEVDNYRKDFLRVFKTLKECERYLEIQEAFKEESKKFKANWHDKSQHKYYIRYNCASNKILTDFSFSTKGYCDYFESREVLEELIERFGKEDIKKYYLGIEE